MEDKKFTCCDCKKEFVWTVKEQQFFKDNKIDKDPVRCRDCAISLRDKRKKETEKEKKNIEQEQNNPKVNEAPTSETAPKTEAKSKKETKSKSSKKSHQ